MIRSRGRPVAFERGVAHHVHRVGEDDDDGVGAELGRVLGRVLADDLGVAPQQVFARHAGLARRPRRDHDDVGARRRVPVVRGGDLGLEATEGGALVDVQRFAVVLGELRDVLDHDVADVHAGQPVGHDAAGLPASDDSYLLASHPSWVSSIRYV